MDNRLEAIVRAGGKPITVAFRPEFDAEQFILDPRRSVAAPVKSAICRTDVPAWRIADFLLCLMRQFNISAERSDAAISVAFHTIFPSGTAEALAALWPSAPHILKLCSGIPRIVNNPFFHSSTSASPSRLLEVAECGGATYAIDLASEIPSAEAISHEIAALHHSSPSTVCKVSARLLPDISAALT